MGSDPLNLGTRDTSTSELPYLPFLDGLRAISVLAVVLYHAGLKFIPGGFIGVDIFFVISGFLIINQIARRLQRNDFSLTEFYGRRCLRILPPFFVVLGASALIASVVLVTPPEVRDFGQQAAWSSLMLVNHFFASQQGYFDAAAETKPLLNIWSLAVEEQFYLGVPLTLLALWLIPLRYAVWIVGVLAMASFAGCVYFTSYKDTNYSFYYTTLRAWEFIAGGSITLISSFVARLPAALVTGIGVAGIAMIGAGATLLGTGMPYPYYYALLPVLGAVCVIVCGVAEPSSIPARALSIRPMVAIGLISYSWYLWHWPLLSFWRTWSVGRSSLLQDLAVVGVSLVLAILTYLLVERPIRIKRRLLPNGWQPIAVAGGLATGLLLAGFFHYQTPHAVKVARAHLQHNLWPDVERLNAKRERDPCFARQDGSIGAECKPHSDHVGLLIGDSHAGKWYEGIRGPAANADVELISLVQNGCEPFLIENSSRCRSRFNRSLGEISAAFEQKPDFAILGAAWNRFFFGLGWKSNNKISRSDEDRFLESLSDSIALLERLGIKRFLLIGPVPELAAEAPICLQRAADTGRTSEICSVPRRLVEKRRKYAVEGLLRTARERGNVRFVDPIDVFCDASLCRPINGGDVLYIDDNHLSGHGSSFVYRNFESEFEWAMGTANQRITRRAQVSHP